MGGRTKWIVIAAWVIAAIISIPFQSKLQVLAFDESDAFKDRNAESTQVDALINERFEGGDETTAVVLYTQADQPRMEQDLRKFCDKRRIPDVVRAITPVHLLLTDVVMPGMSGPMLVGRLREEGVRTSILYTSGYADDALLRADSRDERIQFLPKPYTGTTLLRRAKTLASASVWQPVSDAKVGVEWNYVGPRVDVGNVRLASYQLVNVLAQWSIDKNFELFGRVENLLDKSYETADGYPQAGLSAFIGLRWKL